MARSMEDWDRDFNKRPLQTGFKGCFFLIIILAVLSAVTGVIGYTFGWFGEAGKVLQEQVGPRAVLVKYEWFKDAAASLEAKKANILQYRLRLENLKAQYEGQSRSEWARADLNTYSLAESELLGIAAGYNQLAAKYNANMAKVNYRFANVGQVPHGAEALPREYRDYLHNNDIDSLRAWMGIPDPEQ